MTSVYDFTAIAPDGSQVPLRQYEGKVLLIVNVASKCGLTPQYEGLESLYRDDRDRGLEILGFPCNQFREQETGHRRRDPGLLQGHLRRHVPGVRARSTSTAPTPTRSTSTCGPRHPATSGRPTAASTRPSPRSGPRADGTDEIKWNFTKFLVGRDGTVIKRYEPPVRPADIKADLENYL